MKKFLVCIFEFLFFASAFSQTAWVREHNELYSSLSPQYATSTKYYNLNGQMVNTTAFTTGGLYWYNEYGITRNLTGIVSLPIFKINGYATTNKVIGLGDLTIGLKLGLFQATFPIAYTAELEIPTGNAELYAVNKINTFEVINLPTGDGELNLHNKFSCSHSFYPKPVYLSAYFDYNLRTHYADITFNDQVGGGLEFGYETPGKIWLIAKANLLKTLGETKVLTDFSRGQGTAYSQFQLEAVIPVTNHFYMSGRVGGLSNFPIASKNIYGSPVFGLGFAYKGLLTK